MTAAGRSGPCGARTAMKVGFISNPLSQQNRRDFSGIAAAAEAAGMAHRRLADMSELAGHLDDFARREIGLVVVNGGDGTVQAVLTELLERRPFATLPVLAILPRGMTNMTAADAGLGGRPQAALARLARLVKQGDIGPHLARRHVLRLENLPDDPPQRGMFFGAGAIYQAIEYCRSRVHPWQVGANWAAGLTLAGLLAGWLLRGAKGGAISGHRIGVSVDGGPLETDDRLLVLATTLDRLVLRSRPYWGEEDGPLRYTALSYPPRHILRHVLGVLYGGPRRRLPPAGYVSRNAWRVSLELDGPFTLDGQLFQPPTDAPLVLTAPDAVDFVRY